LGIEHWETYYRDGAAEVIAGHEQSMLHHAWMDFFSSCQNGTRILDICTGNGAVAAIAREVATVTGRNIEIHACDLARIDPMQNVADAADRLEGIRFHPQMAIEKMPFPNASFDAVSGQYALEYTDIPKSMVQIYRVLKSGGGAQFVIHHSGSPMHHHARVNMREAEFILQDTKLYRRLRQLASTDQATPKFAQNAGKQLQLAIQAIKRALPEARAAGGGRAFVVALDTTRNLLALRTQYGPAHLNREIDIVESSLRHWVHRLKDLVNYSKDRQAMLDIENQALQLGFEIVGCGTQTRGEQDLVGWKLMLRKP
jgi:ubiquinone/menaquinone biosynthesis C-methylase UbiE